MTTRGDAQRIEGLIERLREQLAQRSVVHQAAGTLIERYHLTPAKALTFLTEKAHKGHRDVADVAQEILDKQAAPYTTMNPTHHGPIVERTTHAQQGQRSEERE